MTNENIKWQKEFIVSDKIDSFRLFVSSHGELQYFASILYYQIKPNGFDTEINYLLKTFHGNSEFVAMELCKTWIMENLGANFSFTICNTPSN